MAASRGEKKNADLTESPKPSFSKSGNKDLVIFSNLQVCIHTPLQRNLWITLCSYLKLLIAKQFCERSNLCVLIM